jgi:hypothetical protein
MHHVTIRHGFLLAWNGRTVRTADLPYMTEHIAAVGFFSSHTDAETSIKELQRAECGMKKLSIAGKD